MVCEHRSQKAMRQVLNFTCMALGTITILSRRHVIRVVSLTHDFAQEGRVEEPLAGPTATRPQATGLLR